MTEPRHPHAERFAAAPRGDRAQPRRVRCLNPFRWLEVGDAGEVTPCCSPWFKGSLGNVKEQSVEEIWNGPAYQELRDAMYEGGDWPRFCNAATCPQIQNDTWVYPDFIDSATPDLMPLTDPMLDAVRDGRTRLDVGPTQMGISCDPRCNLKCVMCATLTNPNRDGSALRAAMEGVRAFLPTLRRLKLMGDGEVFAVPESRDFLFEFDQAAHPDLAFTINTNGVLLTPKLWERVAHCRFAWMSVSMDGATKATYEKIRVGGKWETLIDNLRFLVERRRAGAIDELLINMCVMRSNAHEMVAFAELAKELGVDGAYYLPILGDYREEQIFEPADAALLAVVNEQLRHPIFADPKIVTDALTPWKGWRPPAPPSLLRRVARRVKRAIVGRK